ncbi:MAG TPA: hypothetical protein PLM79_04345 [Syntrophobacteraceae bacterium]|nr:hypothetical protein [Syntrophobacteraceae bacterium]
MPLEKKEKLMERQWFYKNLQIREGLKPQSELFKYYFIVSDGGRKKCRYCVWIPDDALTQYQETGDFDAIIGAHRDRWSLWVTSKIDAGDFRNLVLKLEKSGEKEYDLDSMDEKLTME